MYKYLLLLFILSVSLMAQINDSVKIVIPADTLIADTMSAADSIALADTTALLGDALTAVIPDTIRPIYQRPLYEYSRFVTYKEFSRRSYNYTGDIFSVTPFYFDVSTGLSGHPSNLLLYATGSSVTSYLVNGINYNDYSALPYDLNRLQSEYIDSAEVIPLTRGFLYGPANNSSAINFIGKDFLTPAPYTKIRYYEGPYGEGYFDGMFNSVITSRVNLFLEMTNRKADNRFVNTDYGKWNGRIQLKYLLSNSINLLAGYDYTNTYAGIPGGINIQALDISGSTFYDELYSEITAPPVYTDMRFNTYTNSVFLKSLGSFGSFSYTDLTLYYRANRIELNQPPGANPAAGAIFSDNLFKNKTAGISVNQQFRRSIFDLNIIGSLEKARADNYEGFKNNRIYTNQNITSMSLAGVFSLSLFDSFLHPSVFYKFSSRKYNVTEDLSGYGTDVNAKVNENTTLYAGYSEYESLFALDRQKNIQAGLNYRTEFFTAGLTLFSRSGTILYNNADSVLNVNSDYYYPKDAAGISLDMNVFVFSKIQLEGKVDYYRVNNDDPSFLLPPLYASGGIFYHDSLFTGNLDLKTGFNFNYYGRRNYHFTPSEFAVFRNTAAGPDVRLDFFISGEIQGAAIVFFTWENVLDTRYFLLPFYPMPPTGVRFGVNWELFN